MDQLLVFLSSKFPDLCEDNFIRFAMSHYNNPCCRGLNEFREDMERLRYIKRLISKAAKNKPFRERLAINHLIVITNVFGVLPTIHMILHRLGNDHKAIVVFKTMLMHLKLWPKIGDSIEIDVLLLERLNQG